MCQECAATVHKHCSSISTVAKVASEKKEKLKTAEKVLEVRDSHTSTQSWKRYGRSSRYVTPHKAGSGVELL